jgi:4-hydroxythreonine-4-phosphate dehydrogenase
MLRVGICIGDPTGVGPEVTLKALANLPEDDTRFVLFGDAALLDRTRRSLKLEIQLGFDAKVAQSGTVSVRSNGPPLPQSLPQGSAPAAEAAMRWLTEAGRACLANEIDAMVTAPVNKEAIIKLGRPFTGQTEYLSELANASRTAMMLLGPDDRGRWLRVALVTTHLPLRAVADHITQQGVEQTIELAAQACRDLGLSRSRVAVCGLNPHAGEGGELGREEITTVTPAVKAAQTRGIDVEGPFPADTIFYYVYRGDYDVVVAMYHDQGLVPLKMIGFDEGINWTLGLPFIRTSPDHGTAYNIAGQGKASPSSMIAAINLAKQLARAKKAAPQPS